MADEPIIGTLKELSIEYSKKQPKQVEFLTQKTPLLDAIKWEPASHKLWNAAEVVTDLSGGGFVDMDAPLSDINYSTELKKVDLKILGGKMFVPEVKAQAFGGKEKWFAKRSPGAMKKLGMDSETAIIYNNLRPYALACGNKINAGGTGNVNYSIMVVRWEQGETCGLYNPEGFGQGALINNMAINGGNLYERRSDGQLGYGVRLLGYFGLQLLNPHTVSIICNITASTKPTEMQVDDSLDMARADASNTMIICHPKAQGFLSDIGKGQRYQMDSKDDNVKRRIKYWDDIPIISTRQCLEGTEALVPFA